MLLEQDQEFGGGCGSRIDNVDYAAAAAADMMIDVEDGHAIQKRLVTLVERAKTWQFTGIQGDDQVKILVIQCKLQGVDSWKKGQRARRGIGAGGNTGFADVGQYMSKPESGADAIAIGAHVSRHAEAVALAHNFENAPDELLGFGLRIQRKGTHDIIILAAVN